MADALFLYAKHRIRNTCIEGEGIWRRVAELPDEASFRHGRVQPSPFHLQCGFISWTLSSFMHFIFGSYHSTSWPPDVSAFALLLCPWIMTALSIFEEEWIERAWSLVLTLVKERKGDKQAEGQEKVWGGWEARSTRRKCRNMLKHGWRSKDKYCFLKMLWCYS